jgi:hypothetical protein
MIGPLSFFGKTIAHGVHSRRSDPGGLHSETVELAVLPRCV